MLQRFEIENGGELLVATLCLLEVSARGLLETELLTILGDEDNLMPPKEDDTSTEGKEKGGSIIQNLIKTGFVISRGAGGPGREILQRPPSVCLSVCLFFRKQFFLI